MEEVTKITTAGKVCLNPECVHYKVPDQGNLVKNGHNRKGTQRLKCKSCQKVFCERKGTLFYRKRTDEAVIIDSLISLGTGSRLSSVQARTKKTIDTLNKWVAEASAHSEGIQNVLLTSYQLGPSEVDGFWTYVRNKGEKKRPY